MRVPCWLSGWFTLEKRRMKRIKKTWGAPFQLCYSYHYFSLEKGSTSLASSHSELVWVEEGSFACFGIDIGISILSLVNLKKVLGENQILCFSTSCVCVCLCARASFQTSSLHCQELVTQFSFTMSCMLTNLFEIQLMDVTCISGEWMNEPDMAHCMKF